MARVVRGTFVFVFVTALALGASQAAAQDDAVAARAHFSKAARLYDVGDCQAERCTQFDPASCYQRKDAGTK